MKGTVKIVDALGFIQFHISLQLGLFQFEFISKSGLGKSAKQVSLAFPAFVSVFPMLLLLLFFILASII